MILIEQLTPIARMLVDAAKKKSTISYSRFHCLFPDNTRDQDKYETLEATASALASRQDAIYEALFVKRGTGTPADGFFDIYKNVRSSDYQRIAGQTLTLDLTQQQQVQITQAELALVYAHAAEHF